VSLYKRGDVYWYDFTIGGARYRESTHQLSKTAARKAEEQARARAMGCGDRAIPTLREATRQWYTSRAQGRKSEKTIAQRVKIMLALMPAETEVTEISTADVEAAVQARRLHVTHNGRAPTNGTVNRDIIDTTLRPVLRYCAEVLELQIRPIAWSRVKLPEPKGRSRAFTAAEIEAWRDNLPEWHRPVFDFMARYGVRLKEAFFPPAAFDAQAGEVTIRNRKNGLPLTLPLLPEDVRDIAARASRATAAGLPTVWFRDKAGELTPIHWRGFQSASRTALEGAGITDARPAHDLRHHAATQLRRTGDVTLVQMMLGHEDLASTTRYAHASKADLLKALRHAYATIDPEGEAEYKEDKDLSDGRTGT
jgi:integrase